MDLTGKYEVVIVGGGTAGIVAAIAAARQGVNTLLLEAKGHLGGCAAMGMTIGGFYDKNYRQVIGGIPQEIAERALELKGGLGHFKISTQDRWTASLLSIDPEIFKYVTLKMLEESGCKLLLYTLFSDILVQDSKIKGVEIINISGKQLVLADVVIDTTGNGDVSACAGVPFKKGRDPEGVSQPVSCIMRIGNVYTPKLEQYMNDKINTEGKDPWDIITSPGRASHQYWVPWRVDEDASQKLPLHFGVYHHGNKGDIFINATHFECTNVLDAKELTSAVVELRKQAMEIMNFLKKKVPGFEEAYLAEVYDLGVRDSRRIIGDYILTAEDVGGGMKFNDVVAQGAYPPDIHKGYGLVEETTSEDNILYQIPYRCLLPENVDCLLVAGRCISATFEAQAAIRGMGPCMATGQAAGTAAALAVKRGLYPRKLDVQELQDLLKREKAFIG